MHERLQPVVDELPTRLPGAPRKTLPPSGCRPSSSSSISASTSCGTCCADRLLVGPRRSVAAGNGLVFRPVEHAANGQLSREEAHAVAEAIRTLLGTSYADELGHTRPLTVEDVLVVTPYNAQVRALRQTVPEGVRVGTVDKFQGQEAPVVIVSLASSSGEEAPRGLSFVFNQNRINVATSRAQCRVELVCSPRLLEADCKTVEEMRLVNALCRFVELADQA